MSPPSGRGGRGRAGRGDTAKGRSPAKRAGAPRGGGAAKRAGLAKRGDTAKGRPPSGAQGRPRGRGQRGTTPARPRASSDRRALGGEQVEGRHAVLELLVAGTRRTREVLVAADLDAAPVVDDIVSLARELKVPVREVGRGRFEAMARTEAPQGVLALAAPLREHDLDELAGGAPSGGSPFLLVLDGVTDPGNLGALLRSAECAGVTGVVLPRHRAAHITPAVTKAAAGAVEHLRMATVPGLPSALRRLRSLGVWSVGLHATAPQSLFGMELADQPVALVLGAEGTGLSRLVAERCDLLVQIPLRGRLSSLNVSVAGALACFEVARRREGIAGGDG